MNSKPKDFEYLLCDQDDVQVYSYDFIPQSSSFLLLPDKPAGECKFILDVHLGGLARYLRFLGFDTLYDTIDPGDNTLANIACEESRVLLTRDIGLLKHTKIQYGHWLRNTQPKKQLLEIVLRYDLKHCAKPFSRCSLCNGLINKVEKVFLKDRISSSLYSQFEEFWVCENCTQVYWKGKHYYAIKKSIDDLLN